MWEGERKVGVRVKLPTKYPSPSAPPVVEMLTLIFHPHVYPNLTVCMIGPPSARASSRSYSGSSRLKRSRSS